MESAKFSQTWLISLSNTGTDTAYIEGCLTMHLPHEIMWNANLVQQGNFIDVFLAQHVSGPSSGALDVELQHMVFCTEFSDGWWSWEPLRGSCVRCGWCRALHHPHRTNNPMWNSCYSLIVLKSAVFVFALLILFMLIFAHFILPWPLQYVLIIAVAVFVWLMHWPARRLALPLIRAAHMSATGYFITSTNTGL